MALFRSGDSLRQMLLCFVHFLKYQMAFQRLLIDTDGHALLRLSGKLIFGYFVVEQKSKQNNYAQTNSWLTVSKVHGYQCLYERYQAVVYIRSYL